IRRASTGCCQYSAKYSAGPASTPFTERSAPASNAVSTISRYPIIAGRITSPGLTPVAKRHLTRSQSHGAGAAPRLAARGQDRLDAFRVARRGSLPKGAASRARVSAPLDETLDDLTRR